MINRENDRQIDKQLQKPEKASKYPFSQNTVASF